MEDEVVAVCVDEDLGVFVHAAFDEVAGERVEYEPLDDAFQGSCSVDGVVASFGDAVEGGISQLKRDAFLGQACSELIDLDAGNFANLLFFERMEDDRIVDAVEELGAEVSFECFVNVVLLGGVADFVSEDFGADV